MQNLFAASFLILFSYTLPDVAPIPVSQAITEELEWI
jgi:hypothetical protein